MLELPTEYTIALEEVLGRNLSGQALEDRNGKAFIQTIADAVIQISHGLTKDRSDFVQSKYLNDTALRQGYLVYYTSTNLLKLWPPLRELAMSRFFEGRKSITHLDLGSGTGAALWGLASYLKREQPGIQRLSSLATDLLSSNLGTVKSFHARFQDHISPLTFELQTAQMNLIELPSLQKNYDLITLMNVLNEVSEEQDERTIEMLSSLLAERGAIIMIEPATRQESRRALRFRDRMVRAGFHVYAPCCRTGECPALINENDWCHTEVQWERPAFIQAIDDLAGTLRLSLKSTYAVFLREDTNLTDFLISRNTGKTARDFFDAGRIVSERFDEKGRIRMFICNERGRKEYVMNKRDRTSGNKDAMKARRYDLVQIENVEVRGHDVKAGKESIINILSNAEGCEAVDNLEQGQGVDK
jgi:ribosomal protein RSM22 (predicted rRNA methylase)